MRSVGDLEVEIKRCRTKIGDESGEKRWKASLALKNGYETMRAMR